ncbi:unnamed protein product, partial [Rhizoctonia solani]
MTSFALKWLIQNCETPSSVDIALQAIAGASSRIPLEPLESCQATLRILQRLVSSNPDNATKADTKLYSRALAVLGSRRDINQDARENREMGDIQVAVWDLKSEHERRVVDLIQNTEFSPNRDNLEALRDDEPASRAFDSIINRIVEHINSGSSKYSQAALQS